MIIKFKNIENTCKENTKKNIWWNDEVFRVIYCVRLKNKNYFVGYWFPVKISVFLNLFFIFFWWY